MQPSSIENAEPDSLTGVQPSEETDGIQIVEPSEPLTAGDPEIQDSNPPAGLLRRIWNGFWSMLDWLFGFGAILFGLAILSVIPILNFLSLGYLLEVSGRVAETGKLRAGFVGIRKASVVGSITIGIWVVLLPIRFVSGLWKDAELIAAGSATATGWRIFLIVLSLLAAWHIAWACLRGGRIKSFLWPAPIRFFKWLGQPGKYTQVRNGVLEWIAGLRLPHYFWLGFRGFVGAVMWLAIPVGVLILAANAPNNGLAAIGSLFGAGLLMIAVMYLPFMQAHFARTNRFEAMFQIGQVRQFFRRAPIAFWFALLITLLFAFPLYFAKVQLPPRELAWLLSLLFVVFIFPARLLTGWAMSRGVRREAPRHWTFRWMSRLAVIPIAAAYVFWVWLTQFISWEGAYGMLEQHAFLVPAPLMGL